MKKADYPPQLIEKYHAVIEELGPETMKERLRQMHLIRVFEERIDQMYIMGQTYGPLPPSSSSIGLAPAARATLSPVSGLPVNPIALMWCSLGGCGFRVPVAVAWRGVTFGVLSGQ